MSTSNLLPPKVIAEAAWIIAVDPGEARIGYALFDSDCTPIWFAVCTDLDTLLDFIETLKVKYGVLEVYRNRGMKHDNWSKNATSQVIGAVKRSYRKIKAELIEQEPSPCLTQGLKFIGKYNEYKGKHVPDEISALAHGEYFIRRRGLRK